MFLIIDDSKNYYRRVAPTPVEATYNFFLELYETPQAYIYNCIQHIALKVGSNGFLFRGEHYIYRIPCGEDKPITLLPDELCALAADLLEQRKIWEREYLILRAFIYRDPRAGHAIPNLLDAIEDKNSAWFNLPEVNIIRSRLFKNKLLAQKL